MVSAVTGIARDQKQASVPAAGTDDSSPNAATGGDPPSDNAAAHADGDADGDADARPSKMRPGVAFWIAVRTHDCMLKKLETMFVNMFMACGFSIYQCKVPLCLFAFLGHIPPKGVY